jgi:hypothetical protein
VDSQTDMESVSPLKEALGRRDWIIVGGGGAGGSAYASGRGAVAKGGSGGAGPNGKPGKRGKVAYGDKKWWEFWK